MGGTCQRKRDSRGRGLVSASFCREADPDSGGEGSVDDDGGYAGMRALGGPLIGRLRGRRCRRRLVDPVRSGKSGRSRRAVRETLGMLRPGCEKCFGSGVTAALSESVVHVVRRV